MELIKKSNTIACIIICSLVMICSLLLTTNTSYAADEVASGICGAEGSNVTWTLDSEGVLTLTGDGATKDYNIARPGETLGSPFKEYKDTIKRVEINSGITHIGACMFQSVESPNYCTVVIPNTVTSIGDSAFWGLSSRAEVIYVPDSVNSVGNYAFAGGSSTGATVGRMYTNVIVCNSDAYIASEEAGLTDQCLTYDELSGKAGRNINYTFDLDSATLTFSGNGEFYESTFYFPGACIAREVIFDDSINATKLPDLPVLFNVEEIVFPNTVTSIPERYCWMFGQLKEITVPQSITEIGQNAFDECYSLERVALPNNLKEIPGYCFNKCTALTEIELPDSLENVFEGAFHNCNNLEKVTFKQFDNEFGKTDSANQCTVYGSFDGCNKLTTIVFSNNVPNLIFNGGVSSSKIKSLYFPSMTLTLGPSAFSSNLQLEEVVIKATTVNIDKYAFAYCSALDSIKFEGVSGNNYASIETSAFDYVNNVTIFGYAGSAIETFANNNSISFVQLCDGTEGGTHKYSEWTINKDATCTETGSREHTCEVCGYKETVEIEPKSHSWNDEYTIDKEATCTEAGEKSIHCSVCDSIKADSVVSIDALEHDWYSDYTVDREPTCTETGEKSIHCKNCIERKQITEIEALSHSYAEFVIEPTCSQNGYTLHVCGRCGDSYTDNEIKAKGHTLGNWITDTDSTCTAEGIQHRECFECGYIETKGINKKEHNFSTEYTMDKEVTCTTDGSKSYHCTVDGCTAITGSVVIPATGHTYSEWVMKKAPACEEAGISEHECSICHAKETLVLPATDHDWMTKATIDTEPTCTTAGSKAVHCKACDAIKEGTVETIPATGHSYGSWETTTEPTCSEDGQRSRTCAKCGNKETEAIAATNHKWSDAAVVDTEPTCTKAGTKSIHCKVCGTSKEDSVEEIPATGHIYGSWETTKEPTCTETGVKSRTCSKCRDKEEQEIPATGHKWAGKYTVDQEATCTTAGQKSMHCKVCDAIDEDSVVNIEPLDHDYIESVVEPTCTQGGYTLNVCSRCGYSYTDNETKAAGHTFGDWVTDTDSTCTSEGIQHRDCTVCGYQETKGINKKDHTFSTEFTVDKEATCTTDGSRSYHCTADGCTATTGNEVIHAAGHQYTEWTETKKPSCTEDGDAERHCTVCGTEETVHFEARGHVWIKDPIIDKQPTCKEAGSESIHCAICDAIKDNSEKEIPKTTSHKYGAWKTVREATTEATGLKERECSVCGDKETEEIPKIANPADSGSNAPVSNGTTATVASGTYTVISTSDGTVSYAGAKDTQTVTIPETVVINGKTYVITEIDAKAFAGKKKIRTVTIGKNVKKIKKNTFKGTEVTKLIVKTKKLTKKSVKGCLKGSKVKSIKVKVGSKKTNKKYVKKYKKIFTKKNAGKKVTVK